MRKTRVTWSGAYHHIMSRGINHEKIFGDDKIKSFYLNLLKEKSKKFRIRIFAYCVMDNHLHLILENSSGRMSDMFRQLNGQYASYYRKKRGGRGYVFHDRFKSTIIQDDYYLISALLYTLRNPVKAGIVEDYSEYRWSSGKEYFVKPKSGIVDVDFVLALFGGANELDKQIRGSEGEEFRGKYSKFGAFWGEENFPDEIEEKFNRRTTGDGVRRRRSDDMHFEPVEKVIHEFEKKYKVKIEDIDTDCHYGKRLRGELLVLLRDLAGLKYREIIEFSMFSDVQYRSMGHLYKNAKEKMSKKYKF